MADRIAVIDAPGKLIAYDTPVALKASKGEGYSVSVKFGQTNNSSALYRSIEQIVPSASYGHVEDCIYNYQLKTRNTATIAQVARLIQNSTTSLDIVSYELHGTTIEDVFLDLLAKEEPIHPDADQENDSQSGKNTKTSLSEMTLSQGRLRSPWAQATTIFHKRLLILRRSWILPLLAMFIGIAGAWWPVRFVHGGVTSCGHQPFTQVTIPSYPPFLSDVLVSPPSAIDVLNRTLPELYTKLHPPNPMFDTSDIDFLIPQPSKEALINNITASNNVDFSGNNFFFTNGGFNIDLVNNELFFAVNAFTFDVGFIETLSNLYWSYAANTTGSGHPNGRRLLSSVSILPTLASESLFTLEWVSVFGAVMVSTS